MATKSWHCELPHMCIAHLMMDTYPELMMEGIFRVSLEKPVCTAKHRQHSIVVLSLLFLLMLLVLELTNILSFVFIIHVIVSLNCPIVVHRHSPSSRSVLIYVLTIGYSVM